MVNEIKNELQKLETTHNIKILYAVESGSRAWGFESADSDWDVRFIYVHNEDWYLSVEDHKDSIETMLPNDLDIAGWELKKTLLLFRKSNPALLEWLNSPIIYKKAFSTVDWIKDASSKYFNPKSCIYHYLNIARNNYDGFSNENMVKLKKYFYILRPLLACSWIEREGQIPPIEFEKLLNAESITPELRKEIDQLLVKKKSSVEVDKGERIKLIDEYIESKLSYYTDKMKEFQFENQPDFNTLNTIFKNTLTEAWN